MVWLILACASPEPAAAPELTIPADNPMWAQLNGFLPNPGMYGEASWDDVRMRVVQHVASIGRDRARAYVAREDYAGCSEAYRDTARRVDAISADTPTGRPIKQTLRDAALRDAALCDALARREAPPVPATPVASLRARHYAWVLHGGDHDAIAKDAARVDALALSLDAFGDDFEARHRLRVALVEAWADGGDPLHPTDPWGYWEPEEVVRTARAIATATAWHTPVPRPVVVFTVEQLGALPTGDTYVDTAGFPGPRAIGRLEKLSLEDPEHRAWLQGRADALNAADHVPRVVEEAVAVLEARPFGSRYYNVKQVRNAAVRVLAGRNEPVAALEVLRAEWPLHAQDWACPDRAAILLGIEGRLRLLAGDASAMEVLDRAMAEADRFLARVASAPPQPVMQANGPPGPPPR